MNDTARKLEMVKPGEPQYREAPNNVEAEQALLGAILVNNDAFYRVSDFLKPPISMNRCTARSMRLPATSSAWARPPIR